MRTSLATMAMVGILSLFLGVQYVPAQGFDLGRGIENYRAIIYGEKRLQDLSGQEQAEVLYSCGA